MLFCIASSHINILNADPLMKELSFAEVTKQMEVGLLTSHENRRAASIINKGIEQSSELLSGVVLAQHSAGEENVSLAEFVRGHVWLIISVAARVILVLGLLLRRLYVSQKRLVAALEEARNANTANIAKTTFLNNMSHDIRAPMNAIMGFTGIALKHQSTPEIRSCLEKIRQSLEYLLALINDVLDISRIESGSVQYIPAPVNIIVVTDSVLDIANGFFVGRNLQLRVQRAEDNDLNAEIAQLLLEEQGMQVTRAADGRESVARFAECPAGTFDLILMDIMMPHMNGYEATKAIRALSRPDAAAVPNIAMTADAFAEEQMRTLEAGMNEHLSKPIDPPLLYSVLEKYIQSKR